MLGIDDADLTFGSLLSESDVEKIIITGWRQGRVDPNLAGWLLPSIQSVVWAADRYEGWTESAVGLAFCGNHLDRRIAENFEGWTAKPDFARDLEVLSEDAPRDIQMEDLYTWLCGNHDSMTVLTSFTPLEARFLGPDPARDAVHERLEAARSDIYLPLAVPGAWPNRQPGATPAWVRDVVATDGARNWRSSTGYVITLTVVVETDRDERSLTVWTYDPRFGVRLPKDESVELLIVLDYADDPAYLTFYFSYTDYRTSQQLDVLLDVRLVRIEFYRLRDDGNLSHLSNFGVTFPTAPELEAHRARWKGPRGDRFHHSLSPTDFLAMIDQRQRALFEPSLPTIDQRARNSRVKLAWERRLQVLDAAATAYASARPVDETLLSETLRELRLAEATVSRVVKAPNPQAVGAGEALLHISVTDESWRFSCVVVFRGEHGQLDGRYVDMNAVNIDQSTDLESQSDLLVRLLEPIRFLLEYGVADLLISAGLGMYSIPLHDAALRLGFRSAAYSHSIRLLHQHPTTRTKDGAVVLGHPGEGATYIAAAQAELEIVRSITGGVAASTWRGAWPRIVHVAGHGISGDREYAAGIRLEGDDFMSASGILRSVDAHDTQVAFLSACDSGSGVFSVGRAGRSIPLDVALLERGCRSVVSTSAPVNDHVALIFAIAFHSHLAAGASPWDSYREARSSFSSKNLQLPSDISHHLDEVFPTWRSPISVESHETWRLFRYSGDR